MRTFCAFSTLGLGLVLALGACGGSASDPSLSAADGGPGASEGGPGAATDSGPGPATGDGGGSDAGDGGDGGVKDTRIDPIEVGHAWTYNVTVLGFYPTCQNGLWTSTTLSSAALDGKTALSVQSLCKDAGVFRYAVDGDRVYAYANAAWTVALDAPVADGHTWNDGLRDYRWDTKGSVTTPAGTFAECWSATVVASYTSYTIFCRGVGPVKWHYEDGFGNGYEAILTAKSF
jgi:hypothetical protein